MTGDSVTVDVIETSFCKPASPSPQAYLRLCACDTLLRGYSYNRRLLFYQKPASPDGRNDEYCQFIATLRRSLSQALVFFYPFAGRLVEDGDGQLTVACNDEGAELVQARICGVSFADLQKCDFNIQPYYVHLTRWAQYSRLHEGSAPLLSIQVTRFPCGNIALGVAHSHVIADGHSLWHFMSSWAESARGEPLSLNPSHDRTLLILQNSSTEDPCFEGFVEGKANAERTVMETTRSVVFSFSREIIEQLKENANNEYGSYEVLCAQLWRKVSSAQLHKQDVRIEFGNVVNMRGKLDPPLPLGYFGNVLCWGVATATMGELQNEDFASTAARIRGAIRMCSDNRMRQMIKFMGIHGEAALFGKLRVNAFRLRVSSSPKFPVMATNFGWGKPLAARPVVIEETGKVVFFPGPSGIGSADACIALPLDAMERLEKSIFSMILKI